MKKLAIPLTALAVASLGACALNAPERPAPTFTSAPIEQAPVAYYTGTGVISKISASPSYSTAAAGGTTALNTVRAGYPFNRLMITMDNGRVQYVDTDSNEFRSGMRVELLPDRTIRPIFR